MARNKFRISNAVGTAFKDVRRALTGLPFWSGYAALASLVAYSIALTLEPSDWTNTLSDLVSTIVLAPFAIAVCRFLSLGETALESDRERRRRRFLEFLGASLLITLVCSLLLTLAFTGWSLVLSVVSGTAAIASAIFTAPWLAAIATDNPTPSATVMVRATQPIFFRLLGAYALTFVILIIPFIAVLEFFPFLEAFAGAIFTFVFAVAATSISIQALHWMRDTQEPAMSALGADEAL